MYELTIYRLFFTDSDCYRKGIRQTTCGVQVHSTGANNPWLRRYVGPDDGRLGENPNGNTHNRPGGTVCANAYIGKLADGTVAVYQALPWDYRCWLSGSGNNGNANKLGYIGFEICEDSTLNEEYFNEAVRGAGVLLAAYLCQQFGINPYSNKLEDHAGLYKMGLASDHGDIGLWLKKFGYSFDDFRGWVVDAMQDGVNVTYVDSETKMEHPTLRRGDSGADVETLQHDLYILNYLKPDDVDCKFGSKTEEAVKKFQRKHSLTVDGVCGPKTWAALDQEMAHDPDGGNGDKPEDDAIGSGNDININDANVIIPRVDWNEIEQLYYRFGEFINKYSSSID